MQRTEMIAAIWRRDYDWLCLRLRKLTACEHSAQDFAMQAFEQLMKIADLETIKEPRALLTTISQRQIYESWRRHDLEQAHVDTLSSRPDMFYPSAEAALISKQSLQSLDERLDNLSVKVRSAFWHSQVDGLPYAEIARRLEVCPASVQQYVAKGLAQCKPLLT